MNIRQYHFVIEPSESDYHELVEMAKLFRNTQAWKSKRQVIKNRDLYLCQICLLERRINQHNIMVHHITPIVENYTKRLDDSNLIALCPVHHAQADYGKISRELLRVIANEPYEKKSMIKVRHKAYQKMIYIPTGSTQYI